MQKCLRDIGIAGATALTLFIATSLWVSINYSLDSVAAHSYYHATLLHGLRPRALNGTLVYVMELSPSEFIMLLQVFKFLWLWLLSFQILRTIADRRSALFLCLLFAAGSDIYICNAMGGFIDMSVAFWLLLGVTLAPNFTDTTTKQFHLRLAATVIAFYCAALTHEIALFGITVFMLWCFLLHGRKALGLIAPVTLLCGHYLWSIWTKLTYGGTPKSYAEILLHFHAKLPGLNLLGLITAAGMLWVVYAIASCGPLHGKSCRKYRIFTVAACALSLMPVIMGADTQRMAGMVIWLPIYLLVMDQPNMWSRFKPVLPVLCVLQLLIPPSFIYARMAVPLNCYALKTLGTILPKDKGNLILPVYIPNDRLCAEN